MIDFKSSCCLKNGGSFCNKRVICADKKGKAILQLKWEKKNRFPLAFAQTMPNMSLIVRLNGFEKSRKARCYGLLLF